MNNIKPKYYYLLMLIASSIILTQCKSAEFTFLGFFKKKYEKEAIVITNVESASNDTIKISIDSILTRRSLVLINDTTGLLSGEILDYQTNNPIKNAIITIYGYNPVYSDSVGYFETKVIKGGENYIIIEKEGYVTNAQKLEILNGWELKVNIKLVKLNIPTIVGVNGGVIKAQDGAKIYIPKNALQKETEISVTIIPLDAYFFGFPYMNIPKPFINMYKLLPDGLIFAKEIKISIPIQNKIKEISGIASENFQSLHIESSDFNPEKLTEEISSRNNISENGDTLFLQLKKFPKSFIGPYPPGTCNRKCGEWELVEKPTKESLRIGNCLEGTLSISFGFNWYFGATVSYSQTLKAPCCMKEYLIGSIQIYNMVCFYDICDPFDNVLIEDFVWETIHKTDNINIETVIIPCCEGDAANPVCCEKNTQCYKWICSGGAAKKVDLPICEECRKQCKQCDPETGKCINFKCADNEKCCDGVCISKNDCCPTCPSGQQCCNGVCKPIEYQYQIFMTVTACDGSSSKTPLGVCDICASSNSVKIPKSHGECEPTITFGCELIPKECE